MDQAFGDAMLTGAFRHRLFTAQDGEYDLFHKARVITFSVAFPYVPSSVPHPPGGWGTFCRDFWSTTTRFITEQCSQAVTHVRVVIPAQDQ